jgi:iron complex outermembrane receptor protein
MHRQTRISRAAITAAVAAVLYGTTAGAQEAVTQATPIAAASGDSGGTLDGLESVIVTARRREERAQDVPIAVNVYSEEAITKQDIRNFTDLERLMPSVSTCCTRGGVSQFTFIRGVNSAVGYFAEVPTLLNGNAFYFDIGNVQVLKGPQGTLFGIATNGGAVLNEPARPTDRFEGYAAATMGDYDRSTIEGVLNVPVSDSFRLRVGYQKHQSDGYVYDQTNRRWLGNEAYYTARVSADWDITDRLDNYLVLNYHSSDRMPEPLGVPYGPTAGIDPNGLFRTLMGPAAVDAWIAQTLQLGRYEIVGTSVPGGPRNVLEQTNVVDITTFDLTDNLTIKNIIGFVQSKGFNVADTDASPFLAFDTSFPTEFSGPSRQYSEELQLQGNAFDDKLTYVVGTFNRWQKLDEPAIVYSYSLGNRAGTLSQTEGTTHSVFAEGTYSLDGIVDGLEFTAGYRYTWDTREASQARYNASGVRVSTFAAEGDWAQGSYRWGVQYKPTAATMFYFTNSKGYSAGGFNLTAPPQDQRYDPEILDNYEVGVKSEWSVGDVRARTNLSVYYGKWDDIQAQVTTRCITATGPVLCQLTRNAATGEIKGFEAEFTLIPWDVFQLSGNVGYMDGEYTKFSGLDPTGAFMIDLSDRQFLYLPEWKYSVTATLDLPVPQQIGRVSVTSSYSYTADINCCFTLGEPQYWTTSPSMDNLNAAVRWDEVVGNPALSAALTVTNVLQNETLHGQWGGYETVGQYARAVAVPRQWSVMLRYKF